VQLSVAARTDVGRIRAGNEDSLYADATPSRGLFIVADGMGGHAAGEVASAMAVQIIARELQALGALDAPDAGARVAQALLTANRAIHERTVRESEKQGMGTTASVLLIADSGYLIGQVGDSRIYLLRDGELRQLTKDHSYVQEQIDAGYLTPEQARYHPYSNVITRCVGASEAVEPDVYAGSVAPGDVFLVAERWPHRDGRRSAAPAAHRVARPARTRRRCAHRRGQRARWPRQHHGDSRPGPRRRTAGARAVGRVDRAHRAPRLSGAPP
jgi:protein phosphatase